MINGTWNPVRLTRDSGGTTLELEQPREMDVTTFGESSRLFFAPAPGAFIVVARPTTPIRRWLLRLATR